MKHTLKIREFRTKIKNMDLFKDKSILKILVVGSLVIVLAVGWVIALKQGEIVVAMGEVVVNSAVLTPSRVLELLNISGVKESVIEGAKFF